jgi:excisionase family DNA binding protein
MEPPVPANVLGLRAAAEYIRVSEHTLRRLVRARAIQYVQNAPRGRIRFKREWLDTYLEMASTAARRRNSKPPTPKPGRRTGNRGQDNNHGIDYDLML